jgi:glycosyltransferase involved in cell wall biosynthesis
MQPACFEFRKRKTRAASFFRTGLGLGSVEKRRRTPPAEPWESGKRVLLITPGGLGERGGIGRLVTHITGYWARTGTGPVCTVIDPYGPRKLALMPIFLASALIQILWHALGGRVALAHINMASWGSAIRKGIILHLATILRIPIVLHLHAGDFEVFHQALSPFWRRRIRGMLARADRLIVLGESWRIFLRDVVGLPERRIVVLENAVAGPEQAPARIANGTCRLLFLGRIEEEKGVPELLAALAHPRLARLDWMATLAGAGDITRFAAEAGRLGITSRVEFAGWQPEPEAKALLARSDVFVLPSHFEGLSIAVLEAMAYELAIVCTPVGSIPSAVEDRSSALFVPVGDIEALANALAEAIEDGALRTRLQKAARDRFNEKFDIDLYCSTLAHIYGDVLRERAERCGRP